MPQTTGFETAKGALEKLPGFVSLPVIARLLAPGALGTALIYPFTGLEAPALELAESDSLVVYLPIVLFWLGLAVAALVIGGLVSIVLGGEIYKVYEGRILWPRRLSRALTAHHARRIETLKRKAAAATASKDSTRADEYWYRLRRYPLDGEGEPYASRPTTLGNILAEYETYPDTRYGMDAVFYWPRIWLALEKEKREEIDSSWSIADGLLSLSAVSVSGGALWLLAAALRPLGDFAVHVGAPPGLVGHPMHLPFGAVLPTVTIGGALGGAGYVWYRLSLPFHRQNGDVFKSMFDLYRGKLAPMTHLGPGESEVWDRVWLYLQYLWVRCARCGSTYPASLERCDACFFPRAQSLALLKRATDPPRAKG